LRDGTVFTISKNAEGQTISHISTSDGLFVDLLSSGHVSQRLTSGLPNLKSNSQVEVSRLILTDVFLHFILQPGNNHSIH
jgi:hypothetical protein